MKGAAGWAHREASLMSTAGGPTGRSVSVLGSLVRWGWGLSLVWALRGRGSSQKHNVTRQTLGLRATNALALGAGTPNSAKSSGACGGYPRPITARSILQTPYPFSLLEPHFLLSFSRLSVLLTFISAATENPSGLPQPPPNMAVS